MGHKIMSKSEKSGEPEDKAESSPHHLRPVASKEPVSGDEHRLYLPVCTENVSEETNSISYLFDPPPSDTEIGEDAWIWVDSGSIVFIDEMK